MRSTDVDQVLPIMTRMFLWLLGTRIMTFGHSKTISNICIGCVITADEIIIFAFVDESTIFHKIQEITQIVDLVKGDETSYENVR